MDRIGDWSQAELRRFIVNQVLSDPGVLPKEKTSGDLFLQLADALRGRKIALGQLTITWPGAVTVSNVATAPHGLGVVPTVVLATLNDSAGSGAAMVTAFRDAMSVSVQLVTAGLTPGGVVTNPVSWIAIA